jgi:hypothetical protein
VLLLLLLTCGCTPQQLYWTGLGCQWVSLKWQQLLLGGTLDSHNQQVGDGDDNLIDWLLQLPSYKESKSQR